MNRAALTRSGLLDDDESGRGFHIGGRRRRPQGRCRAGSQLLLIFGNPSVGTPLMQADPRVGIELPLRMLIWQDSDGTHVGYLDPRELADRYALEGHEETLERQNAVLTKLAAAAAG
jgi:hypothetical protein